MEELIQTYAPFLDVSPIQKLMSPLHNAVFQIHESCGLPIDQLNFLALFLLSYPLAFIFRFIGNTTIRHIYSAFFGVLMVIYMMGNDFYHSLFSAIITYLLLCVVRNEFGTKLIWIWAFGYMSCSHLYIMYTNYLGWNVDFTIVQMIFTLKFCALACNYQDGAFPRKEVSAIAKSKAITSPPNPLEYISYLYYFCTILPGPFFEYKEYISFIDRSIFGPSKQIPSGSLKAFLLIWVRIIVVLAGVFLAFSYHPSYLWKNQQLVDNLNFFARWGLIMISFPLMRCQYYCGWLMSEAAVVISGFGFNGYSDEAKTKPRWDRVTNISLTGVELGTAMKDLIANWNQGTARFLKFYVYFRVSKRPAKPGENPKSIPGVSAATGQLIVFIVSALWHGFYPGYYVFFVSVFICNQIEVWISKKITPLVPNNKTVQAIYSVLSFFVAMGALNYGAISFVALSLDNAYVALANVYFFGHIAMFVLFIATFVLPPPRAPRATTKVD